MSVVWCGLPCGAWWVAGGALECAADAVFSGKAELLGRLGNGEAVVAK